MEALQVSGWPYRDSSRRRFHSSLFIALFLTISGSSFFLFFLRPGVLLRLAKQMAVVCNVEIGLRGIIRGSYLIRKAKTACESINFDEVHKLL